LIPLIIKSTCAAAQEGDNDDSLQLVSSNLVIGVGFMGSLHRMWRLITSNPFAIKTLMRVLWDKVVTRDAERDALSSR
jgi:hypothetical protein